MKYSDFFWKHIDTLCSDTNLAHSFGEKVWNHKQQEIDELKNKLSKLLESYNRQKSLSVSDEFNRGWVSAFSCIVLDIENIIK